MQARAIEINFWRTNRLCRPSADGKIPSRHVAHQRRQARLENLRQERQALNEEQALREEEEEEEGGGRRREVGR